MKIFEKLVDKFSHNTSYGVGILDDNVENYPQITAQGVVDEKRQSIRVGVSVPVWYQIKNSWTKWLKAKSVNHSATGIRLSLPSGVRVGTEISLKMKLPDALQPIAIKGVVVWVTPASSENSLTGLVECGVAFKSMRNVAHKEKLVYLIANKLCKFGLQLTKDLIAAPAETLEDLKGCYRVIYDGYLARKYCQPNEEKMYYHYFSFLPESRTFTLKEKNKLIGTISLVVDSPCGLPMDTLFQREIDHLRGAGRKLAEVSMLAVVSEDKKKKFFSLTNLDKQVRLFRLFKVLYEYARNVAGVTDIIIGVHPKHETLYKYLMFKAMGSVKSYSGARGNPALPMHLDLIAAEENCSDCLKAFFLTDPTPLKLMQGGIKMDTQIVRQFLCEDPKAWSNIPSTSQKYLKQCYPGLGPRFTNPLFKFFKF